MRENEEIGLPEHVPEEAHLPLRECQRPGQKHPVRILRLPNGARRIRYICGSTGDGIQFGVTIDHPPND